VSERGLGPRERHNPTKKKESTTNKRGQASLNAPEFENQRSTSKERLTILEGAYTRPRKLPHALKKGGRNGTERVYRVRYDCRELGQERLRQ